MEDIFKTLLVVAFLVIGVISQIQKDAKKKTKSRPAVSPKEDGAAGDPYDAPLPENWGKGHSWIPEAEPEEEIPSAPVVEKKAASPRHPSAPSRPFSPSGVEEVPSRRSTDASAILPPSSDEEHPAVDIRSVEEVRRGIIWSVILKRADY